MNPGTREDYSYSNLRLFEQKVGRPVDYPMTLAWGRAAEESAYGRSIRAMVVADGQPVAIAQGILRHRLGLTKLQIGSTSGTGVLWIAGQREAAVGCVRNLMERARPSVSTIFADTALDIPRVMWEPTYTFRIDLKRPLPEIYNQMAPEARRKVRKADKLGVTAEGSTSEPALRQAYAIVDASSQLRGFPNPPARYSIQLHREFEREGIQGCVIARLGDRPISAATFLGNGGTALWWKGGSLEEGYATGSGNVVQHAAIAWLKERGVHTYDLGGTNPRQPQYSGIHAFKKSLGGSLVEGVAGTHMSTVARIGYLARKLTQ